MVTSAEELRARAKRLRELAQYAQGQNYRDEMAEAQRLENQARWLDENKDESIALNRVVHDGRQSN